MRVELPPEFVRTIQNSFGDDGPHWLASFPALLEEAARRWDLIDIRPVPNLSYNFVAFAKKLPLTPRSGASPGPSPRRGEGSIIIKLGVPHRELTSEIAALRFYNGRGTCGLLDADAEKGMLLLERLEPGRMLATVMDDERATRIAADVMKKLWECSRDFGNSETIDAVANGFIHLKDWFDGFRQLRERFEGGTGPLPGRWIETAEALSGDFLTENKEAVLLHGDFHHYNILESERGWLAIDPKGVVGPRGYEVGPFLINPFERFLSEGNPRVQTERRISILSEVLGMERERIRAWGICHAVLSAWWFVDGNDLDGMEYSLRCAEIFSRARV